MKRRLAALPLVVVMCLGGVAFADQKPPPVPGGDCTSDGRQGGNCGTLSADAAKGDFHGLIMVPGQPSVLETAAHSGTKPGCGDCTWTLILACPYNTPGHPEEQNPCAGDLNPSVCPHGGLLFRVFLTTDAVRNALVDHLCLGAQGTKEVVPVGDLAAADIQQYLKDVTPPLLALHLNPPNGIPAGMPAYFWVRAPADLRPVPFGNGQVTETITIKPERYDWHWGDGQSSGWITDPGAPYPDGNVTHVYDKAGRYAGTLTTEWGGTYTITVAGRTFGPYDAVGTIARSQPFDTLVLSAHSTLVSQG